MHLLTMAEVEDMKDKGIPLRIDGVTRYVKGATKYTTCSDVIKMVLKKTGIRKEYRHLFVIYEVSNDIEKAIPCKSRILKIVESWRGQPTRLVLRKSDPLTPLALTEKTKKWNLKRITKRQPTIRERRNPFKEIVNKQLETNTDKQQSVTETEAKVSDIPTTSSSDSESSMDEFLSNLDHSKMAGLLNFFVAMAKRSKVHANHKRESVSSLESNGSSNDSPVKQTTKLRKRRSSRNPKRLQSKHRKTNGSDFHPNKMHAVKRVNFGFIDVEPRAYDQWCSQAELRTNEHLPDERLRAGSHGSRVQSVRRRLIPNSLSRSTSNGSQDSGCKTRSNSSVGSNEDQTYTRPSKIRRSLPADMYGTLCNNDMSAIIDSGHEEDSDSSTDLDTAFVRKFHKRYSRIVCENIETTIPEISETSDIDKPLMNSTRKLVNYSMTDDELDHSDGVITTSDNNDDFCSNPDVIGSDNDVIDNVDFYDNKELRDLSGAKELKDSSYNPPRHDANGVEFGSGLNCTIEEIRASLSVKTRTRDVKKVPVCSVRRNSPKQNPDVTNFIKSIFKPQCENEDEEMNSFMKSMILDDSSDDGVCSMESDGVTDVNV